MSLVKVATDTFKGLIKSVFKGIGSVGGVDGGAVGDALDAQDDLLEKMAGKDRGGSFMEREKDSRNQELHTARMFTSTLQSSGDNPIEPSIFYANTVKFPYNLFDYWLRNDEEPFTCRFYYSNNLLNNLIHNNNENPTTYPLNITFEKLGNI